MSNQKLNPQIKEIEIGVRELRSIKLYPLSVADQFDLTKKIADSINEIVGGDVLDFKGLSEAEAVDRLREVISSNLDVILGYVCDKEEVPQMKELTNLQVSDIVLKIFEVNYEGLIKNFKSLFERGKALFPKGMNIPKPPSRRTK